MAARRTGLLLFQRCNFCSRETLKRRFGSTVCSFSRIGNNLLVASRRNGIFFLSGENLLPYISWHNTTFSKTTLHNRFNCFVTFYPQRLRARLTPHFWERFRLIENFTRQVSKTNIIRQISPVIFCDDRNFNPRVLAMWNIGNAGMS